jgi:hypothetical protein
MFFLPLSQTFYISLASLAPSLLVSKPAKVNKKHKSLATVSDVTATNLPGHGHVGLLAIGTLFSRLAAGRPVQRAAPQRFGNHLAEQHAAGRQRGRDDCDVEFDDVENGDSRLAPCGGRKNAAQEKWAEKGCLHVMSSESTAVVM